MLSFFLRWLITAVSLLITAQIVPGIEIKNFTVALIAAVALGLINAIIRPLLILFTHTQKNRETLIIATSLDQKLINQSKPSCFKQANFAHFSQQKNHLKLLK